MFIPETEIDIPAEAERLKKVMDELDNVNLIISEGAGADSIVKEMEAAGEEVPRDALGHIKLNAVNPGAWLGKQLAKLLGAEKALTRKSGYHSRAAASNEADLAPIKECCDKAVECAMEGVGGVIGQDDDRNSALRAIELPRIAGGKPFDIGVDWSTGLLDDIGQGKGEKVAVAH